MGCHWRADWRALDRRLGPGRKDTQLEILGAMKRPARRRSRDPKVERLSHVELFSACSKRELARIAALTVEIEVPAGRVLMRQGDRALECFMIEGGQHE